MEENIINAVLLIFLAVAAYWDCKEKQIGLNIVLAGAVTGIVLQMAAREARVSDILSGVCVGLLMLFLSWMTRESVGAGDGLILMVSGIFLGFWKNISMFMTALVMTGMVGLFLIAVKKKGRNYRLPFVPFLLAAYLFQIL